MYPEQHIYDMKVGILTIPYSALITLAERYNTSIDYLLGVTDEITPYPRAKQ